MNNETAKAMRDRYADEVEALGRDAMDNPIVRYAVHAAERGLVGWNEAMISAVRELVTQNTNLMDRVLRTAAITPVPHVIEMQVDLTDLKPFAWYDHFNDEFLRTNKDIQLRKDGGNPITPLYAAKQPSQ